jgi:hypothetical protein
METLVGDATTPPSPCRLGYLPHPREVVMRLDQTNSNVLRRCCSGSTRLSGRSLHRAVHRAGRNAHARLLISLGCTGVANAMPSREDMGRCWALPPNGRVIAEFRRRGLIPSRRQMHRLRSAVSQLARLSSPGDTFVGLTVVNRQALECR